MPGPILFTTTSRLCRYVIISLLTSSNCPPIRVVTRQAPDQDVAATFPEPLRSPPHSIVIANHYERDEFTKAFRGIDMVFHDGLIVHPYEAAMGVAAVEAAKEHDVKHFILCSVLQPLRRKLQTHANKLELEEYLVESRLHYTILQPCHYMQNVSLTLARETGKIPIGFRSDLEHSFVDIADVTRVVLMVIFQPNRHNYARYELVSQTLTYNEVAQILSQVFGRPVKCDVIPAKKFVELMESSGEMENDFTRSAIEGIMLYYDRQGICGNSNQLTWLLGRPPMTWMDYARNE